MALSRFLSDGGHFSTPKSLAQANECLDVRSLISARNNGPYRRRTSAPAEELTRLNPVLSRL